MAASGGRAGCAPDQRISTARDAGPVARWLAWLTSLAAVWLWLAAAPAAATGLRTLDSASVALQPDGEVRQRVDLTLPLHWDARFRGSGGSASVWLQASAIDPAQDHALYVARVGNAFRVRLNGEVVTRRGGFGDAAADTAKRPQYVRLPARLMRPHNEIEIEIVAEPGRKGGLSRPVFGLASEVRPLYQAEHRWRVIVPAAVSATSAVLALLALLLWVRTREPLYGGYAVCEGLWAFAAADPLIGATPLAWPAWGIVVYSAQVLAGMLICRVSLRLVGARPPWLLWGLHGWMLAGPLLLVLALWGQRPALEVFVLAVTNAWALGTGAVVARHGWRHPRLEIRVLVAAFAVLAIALARDLFVLVVRPYVGWFGPWGGSYGEVQLARVAWIGIGVTMAVVIAERLRRSAARARGARARLVRRLTAQRRQLRAVFEREDQARRLQAQADERQRLMRDMHDGLGSELLGTIQLANDPAVTRERLVRQLRHALDQLKLTVDAMQDDGGDVAALLGALRYRLGPRLQAAGVELAWAVEPLPPAAGWTIDRARDLQMILYEAITNIVVHAGATRARLRAALDRNRGELQIELTDNGVGFDPQAATTGGGRGLANMRARAARLGGWLEIESGPGHTGLCLRLPAAALQP